MSILTMQGLTKDYGGGKGVFDVTFAAEQGEVMGFLGPNGAGKTTTIRQLMGFIRPDRGRAQIKGLDCFTHTQQIQGFLGYLPGEIAFPDDMAGREFIRFYAHMKGVRDLTRAEELMARFELDPAGKIKRMSKGMKQKIGIVCAFMTRPEVLILDEPTSGLDPLMQNKFVDLILEEKARGATILMSSHMFEEVERCCDRAAILKDGKLVAVEDVERLRRSRKKEMTLRFATAADAAAFTARFSGAICQGDKVTALVGEDVDGFLKAAAAYAVTDLDVGTQNLEELFLQFYGRKEAGV